MAKICYQHKDFRKRDLDLLEWINKFIDYGRSEGFRLTIRQVYYQFIGRDLLPNVPASYDLIARLVAEGRMAGLVDWDAIVDRTRVLRAVQHWSHPRDLITEAMNEFAFWKWEDQPNYVEVWVEKDALRDIVASVCDPNDVAYFSSRGYSSITGLHEAAIRFQHEIDHKKTVHLLHLSDHDPSGLNMSATILKTIRDTFGVDIKLHRIGLNMDQIERYELPANPAKASDSRFAAYAEQYGEESWELDALTIADFQHIIQANILHWRDEKKWQKAVAKEQRAKNVLGGIHSHWNEILRLINNPPEEAA